MKMILSSICVLSVTLLMCSCASESGPKKDDRLGAHGGVTVSSRDMSRVAPTRPAPSN